MSDQHYDIGPNEDPGFRDQSARAEILKELSGLLDSWRLFELQYDLIGLLEAGALPAEAHRTLRQGGPNPIRGGYFLDLVIQLPASGYLEFNGNARRVNWVAVTEAGVGMVRCRTDTAGNNRPLYEEISETNSNEEVVVYRPADERGLALLTELRTDINALYAFRDAHKPEEAI